jgi:DNA repair exonuclease SbcCD ATPase subunit
MIIFNSLKAYNTYSYKSLELDLKSQGLVGVIGRNGSGKSTIWGLLESVCAFSLTNKDRLANQSDSKAPTSISLSLTKQGQDYVISLNKPKTKWQYNILCDGKDITPHTFADSVKAVNNILGFTKDEFGGAVHLKQNSCHILIDGTPADRKNYISRFFNLDERFDMLLAEAKKQLDLVDTEISKLSSYLQTEQALKEQLDNLGSTCTKDIDNKISNLEAKEHTVSIHAKTLEGLLDAHAKAHSLYKLNNLAGYQRRLPNEQLWDRTNEINALIRQNPQNIRHNEECQRLQQQRATAQQELYTLEAFASVALHAEEETLQHLSASKKFYEKNRLFFEENASLPDRTTEIDVSILKNQLDSIRSEQSRLKLRLEHLGNGQCPTCGTSIDAKILSEDRTQYDQLAEWYSQLDSEYNALVNLNTKIKRKLDLTKLLSGYSVWGSSQESMLRECGEKVLKKKRYDALSEWLTQAPELALRPVYDITSLNAELASLNEELTKNKALDDYMILMGPLEGLSIESMQKEYSESIESLEKIASELKRLREELGALKQRQNTARDIQAQIIKCQAERANMPTLLRRQQIYKALTAAYGIKGIRVNQLQRIMELIVRRLPHYTDLLFSDKTLQFTSACEANSISLEVEKEVLNFKGEPVKIKYDISDMSGGEKQKLSLALVCTLADCIAYAKKTNLLILDEIDTNLDQEGEARLVNHLLPYLKTKYESIFIISHREELQQAALYDKILRVTSTKAGSKAVLEECI